MNTEKSQTIVSRFRRTSPGAVRETISWSRTIQASPEQVFPLLCPSREADWLPGWDAELIATESGYAEPNCVFRTDPQGPVGPGVWVFTGYDEPRQIQVARFTPDLLTQLTATVEEVAPGRSTVEWNYTLTGLTEKGGEQVRGMAAEMPTKAELIGSALDHYLRTGEMVSLTGT